MRDRSGKLVGVLSNADLARHVTPTMSATVSSLMTSSVVSVVQSASLAEAARVFAERSVHRIVVTDAGGSVVGVVTALDVLRGLHRSGALASAK